MGFRAISPPVDVNLKNITTYFGHLTSKQDTETDYFITEDFVEYVYRCSLVTFIIVTMPFHIQNI